MLYLDKNHDIYVYKDRDHRGSSLRNHFHYVNEIIICHEGRAVFSVNGKEYVLQKNSIIFIGNLESHSVTITDLPYDRSVILLSHSFVNRYLAIPIIVSILSNHLPGFPYIFELTESEHDEIMKFCEILQLEFEKKQAFWKESFASMLANFLIRLYRNHPEFFQYVGSTQSSNTVMQAQLYINEHFADDLTVEGLAERFYTSPSTLSREFKEYTGKSIKTYVILNRLLRAKFLLQTTNRSMISIGGEVGYDNPNHFSRIFKKYTGQTPMEYRKTEQHED